MLKNILILGLLSWISFAYARPAVVPESAKEHESYRVEKPVTEQEAARSVAGSKIKKQKQKKTGEGAQPEETSGLDSEVRYWQYSE